MYLRSARRFLAALFFTAIQMPQITTPPQATNVTASAMVRSDVQLRSMQHWRTVGDDGPYIDVRDPSVGTGLLDGPKPAPLP